MKLQVSFDLAWRVTVDGTDYAVERLLFSLLDGIRRGGHLNYAARHATVSYRHAWGLLRTWEARFGERLVTLQRGRGASLTRAGQTLLDAHDGIAEQTQRKLKDAEAWTAARLATAFDARETACTIVSSHSEAVQRLREALIDQDIKVALDIVGSEGALRRYQRGEADLAGFHLPLGVLGGGLGALMLGLLDAARDQIYVLERRTLGLMSRSDMACRDLRSLVDRRHVFVNRQPGSGTRLVFDGLIGNAGIAPGDVRGYASEEHTHTAVAALVACGRVDVGFGTQAVAAAMELHFEPLVDEHVYLAVRRDIDVEIDACISTFCDTVALLNTSFTSPRPTLAAVRRLHRAAA